MLILAQLQSLLSRLYDVPNECAVGDFLVTNPAQLQALRAKTANSDPSDLHTDEQVFVGAADDGLRVSVYIDAAVLSRLARNSPLQRLSDDNIADYCTAIEGVSHFHYLTWRAANAESVSLLELELQAEVDKYAAAMLLLTEQREGQFPRALHERLFHRVRYHVGLDDESLSRYRQANKSAARFCRQLDEKFLRLRCARPEGWLRELRSFYRLPHALKLRRVEA